MNRMSGTHARPGRGFTLVEALVSIAIIAVLLGLLLPSLRYTREHVGETHCASNVRQLSAATLGYLAAWNNHLPQRSAEVFPGFESIIGALFGGKRGTLAGYGINEIGADERPLNAYLSTSGYIGDHDGDEEIGEDVPVFHCPLDRGTPGDPAAGVPHSTSLYDLVGTSYNLNDHALDSQGCWTLIPARSPPCAGETVKTRPGGPMPRVEDPSLTWMIGDQPIYNYELDPYSNPSGDRHQRWHHHKPRVNLAFVDGHVGIGIDVPGPGFADPATPDDLPPGEPNNTTPWYSFLPRSDWLRPGALGPGCSVCGSE